MDAKRGRVCTRFDSSNPNVAECHIPAIPAVEGWCYSDKREPPRYALLGDSHGEALFWALARNSRPNGRWMILARAACAPIAGVQRLTVNNVPERSADDPMKCAAFNAAAQDLVLHTDTIGVVLIATARRVLEQDEYAQQPGEKPIVNGAFLGLSALVAKLQTAGKSVVFLEDNPYVGNSEDCVPRRTGIAVVDGLLTNAKGAACSLSYDSYRSQISAYLQHVTEMKAVNPGLAVLDSTDSLCDASENSCPMVRDGQFLYSYGDHISTYGGDLIAAALQPAIDNLEHAQTEVGRPPP